MLTDCTITPFWSDRCREIQTRIDHDDIGAFLTWPTVVSTMFVGHAPYVAAELAVLRARADWPRWRAAIHEPLVGAPVRWVDAEVETSGNLIHQAYHLACWEAVSGQRITDLACLQEFGAGYGALALVARRAGFRGAYHIVDLPTLQRLQARYLDACGITGVSWAQPNHAPDLLIAIRSLDEVPESVQDAVLETWPAQACWLAAGDAAFVARTMRRTEWRWTAMPDANANTYLAGVRP